VVVPSWVVISEGPWVDWFEECAELRARRPPGHIGRWELSARWRSGDDAGPPPETWCPIGLPGALKHRRKGACLRPRISSWGMMCRRRGR
jgi:hypothetical protein